MNIVITGISKGLGFALANEYGKNGNNVYGFSRNKSKEIFKNVHWKQCDLTSEGAQEMITKSMSEIDCVDILINNAGSGSQGSQLQEIEINTLRGALDVHRVAPLMMTQVLVDKLKAADNPKVINVTSRLGSIYRHLEGDFKGRTFSYPYRIAKCAQNMLTICMQNDPTLSGVIVAAVNPGLLTTDSGADDAEYNAKEGAAAFIKVVGLINENGSYHAFGETTTL